MWTLTQNAKTHLTVTECAVRALHAAGLFFPATWQKCDIPMQQDNSEFLFQLVVEALQNSRRHIWQWCHTVLRRLPFSCRKSSISFLHSVFVCKQISLFIHMGTSVCKTSYFFSKITPWCINYLFLMLELPSSLKTHLLFWNVQQHILLIAYRCVTSKAHTLVVHI